MILGRKCERHYTHKSLQAVSEYSFLEMGRTSLICLPHSVVLTAATLSTPTLI